MDWLPAPAPSLPWLSSNLPEEPLLLLLWSSYAAVISGILGSFINVVAIRIPEGRSVVRPRSSCPSCGALVSWYDNIPLVSFALLRGRCRRCRTPISWRYPMVEAITVALGLALWLSRGPSLQLLFDAAIVGLLLALALIDARAYIVPVFLAVATAGIALVGRFAVPLVDTGGGLGPATRALVEGVGGAALGALLLGAVAVSFTWLARRSGRIPKDEVAMGSGDIYLITAIGAQTGALAVFPVIFLASVQGTLIAAVVLGLRGLTGRAAPGDRADLAHPPPDLPDDDWEPPRFSVPFGPYLALGAVEWILLGSHLEQWLQRGLAVL